MTAYNCSSEYTADVIRTKSDTGEVDKIPVNVLHAAMGMVTEAGEIMDHLKRVSFYGRPIDRVSLVEEMGDLMWYLGLMASELGITFEEVWEKNIAKLKVRYPDKFNKVSAVVRDLSNERVALEGMSQHENS